MRKEQVVGIEQRAGITHDCMRRSERRVQFQSCTHLPRLRTLSSEFCMMRPGRVESCRCSSLVRSRFRCSRKLHVRPQPSVSSLLSPLLVNLNPTVPELLGCHVSLIDSRCASFQPSNNCCSTQLRTSARTRRCRSTITPRSAHLEASIPTCTATARIVTVYRGIAHRTPCSLRQRKHTNR